MPSGGQWSAKPGGKNDSGYLGALTRSPRRRGLFVRRGRRLTEDRLWDPIPGQD
jgi:hypothetical protein